jgi:plasmid maintenance system killer protein
MIKSFKDKETARIWDQEYSRTLPGDIQERALMKLQQLHAAGSLNDLAIPASNGLEALKGPIQHPHQQPVAHLFQVERGPGFRGGDCGLSLSQGDSLWWHES